MRAKLRGSHTPQNYTCDYICDYNICAFPGLQSVTRRHGLYNIQPMPIIQPMPYNYSAVLILASLPWKSILPTLEKLQGVDHY